MNIAFVTGNNGKYTDALEVFKNTNINLEQISIDTPEIQSFNALEIAKYSAEYISQSYTKPFFLMDRSFHIDSLNGFPGPYVKYINKWLNEDNFEKMLSNSTNMLAKWTTAIACYIPNKGIRIFVGTQEGEIVFDSKGEDGYMVDRIFKPKGYTKTISQMSKEEGSVFWNSCSCWNELIEYLKAI